MLTEYLEVKKDQEARVIRCQATYSRILDQPQWNFCAKLWKFWLGKEQGHPVQQSEELYGHELKSMRHRTP